MSIVPASYRDALVGIQENEAAEKRIYQPKASYANLPTNIHSAICGFLDEYDAAALRATNRSNRVLTTRHLNKVYQAYQMKYPDSNRNPSEVIGFLNRPERLILFDSLLMKNASLFLALSKINEDVFLTQPQYDMRLAIFNDLRIIIKIKTFMLTPAFYAIQISEAEELIRDAISLLFDVPLSSFNQSFKQFKTRIQQVVRTDIEASV